MALRVHNTLSRTKELFVPARPDVVRIYTCGLTVYAPMHIGHARTYCFWDTFRRYLEYSGYHVVSVINYTDIDDRIIARTSEVRGAADVAEEAIASFRRDCRSLRIKDYAAYTRATDFTSQQVEMIAELIRRGHAYVVDGEVFYDVSTFPEYGKLSGRRVDEQKVGASGRVGEDFARKRHPADFTLWKPTKPGEPSWDTGHPGWPSGRPGWHIECSVMSTALLGDQFDVHGGAIDNLFPHHENELAQSEPLCGNPWVRYWLHPEHLDLSGEKMSKSLGNVISVPKLLADNDCDVVRWFFAVNHYRTKVAFSAELIASASAGYAKIKGLYRNLADKLSAAPPEALVIPCAGLYASQREGDARRPRLAHVYTYGRFGAVTATFLERFTAAMDDDLGSPQAAAAFFDWVNELYAAGIARCDDIPSLLAVYRAIGRHLHVFGIELCDERLDPELAADCFPRGGGHDTSAPFAAVIDRLLQARRDARASKDFAKGDLIRKLLDEAGVIIEDTPERARWRLRE